MEGLDYSFFVVERIGWFGERCSDRGDVLLERRGKFCVRILGSVRGRWKGSEKLYVYFLGWSRG